MQRRGRRRSAEKKAGRGAPQMPAWAAADEPKRPALSSETSEKTGESASPAEFMHGAPKEIQGGRMKREEAFPEGFPENFEEDRMNCSLLTSESASSVKEKYVRSINALIRRYSAVGDDHDAVVDLSTAAALVAVPQVRFSRGRPRRAALAGTAPPPSFEEVYDRLCRPSPFGLFF